MEKMHAFYKQATTNSSLAGDKAKIQVTAAIASVAVGRVAKQHGFLMLTIGYLRAGLQVPPGIYTLSTSLPRSFTLAMGRAELPSEQNKDVFKMPLLRGVRGEKSAWERGSGRASPELEDAARQGGNLPQEKNASINLTTSPPAP